MPLLRLSILAAMLTVALCGGAIAGGVQTGETLSFRFKRPVFEGPGVRGSDDLRGKPVLYEFWGQRCPACVNGGIPASLKLQETYGDDLQVVFVEVQNDGPERALGFALRKKWLGGRAMWTSEYPFDAGVSVLPYAVLSSSDGRVLAKGNPLQFHKEFERLIAEDIKQRASPPRGVPDPLRDAWIEFGKGHVARALAVATPLSGAADPALATAAKEAMVSFRAGAVSALARASRMIDAGAFTEAQALGETVQRAVQGDPELEARVAELLTRLGSKSLSAEREAERAFARLEERMFQSGGDSGVVEELERFAARTRTLKIGERAADLVRVARAPEGCR